MPASKDSILNSIKGRIWLAVSALAVLNCFCGLGAYLAVSFLVTDAFVTVFVTFFVMAFVTVVFGWWLSNDVIRPIDSVTLLAKALERSPNATLPRTTGAAETDELLRTLHRNSQQLQSLISMMDDVAAGRTESVEMPLENSDKLTASFQKLVSRVTDSITAKRELDALQSAMKALNADIAGVRGGRLDVQIRTEHPLTKEAADTIRYLATRLDQLARGVQVNSLGAGSAASEAKRVLRSVIESRDEHSARLARGIAAVSELPMKTSSMVRDADSAFTAIQSAIQTSSADAARKDAAKATALNSRLGETARKVQKLRTRIAQLPQLARTANEIARKSNLIALNTSIHSDEGPASSASLNLLLKEVGSLSQRADTLNKEIGTLTDSLSSEVGDLASALSEISTGSGETARAFEKAARHMGEFGNLMSELAAVRSRLVEFDGEQSAESEKITEMVSAVSNDRSEEKRIREAELQLQKLITLVENLNDSVSDIRGGKAVPRFETKQPETPAAGLPFERTVPESIELIGEN